VNLIVIFVTCACFLYSINCPTVICLHSMLFIFMERHIKWTVDPGSVFYIHITIYFYSSNIYFLANKYLLPYDTLNPLFSANRWDWQPHCKLGQSILVVLCVGSTSFAGAPQVYWHRAKSASNNLWELILSPTGRLNFGFTTEGKLTVVLFTPSSWGSQLVRQHRRITHRERRSNVVLTIFPSRSRCFHHLSWIHLHRHIHRHVCIVTFVAST
jgi:hypothetical protein